MLPSLHYESAWIPRLFAIIATMIRIWLMAFAPSSSKLQVEHLVQSPPTSLSWRLPLHFLHIFPSFSYLFVFANKNVELESFPRSCERFSASSGQKSSRLFPPWWKVHWISCRSFCNPKESVWNPGFIQAASENIWVSTRLQRFFHLQIDYSPTLRE